MLPVRITVTLGARKVPVEELSDGRLATAFRTAGQDVASRLEAIVCTVHHKTASNVRVHFDPRGGADLQYDSCCEALGKQIGAAMGGE